jgi:hypothetical protein
MLRYAWRPLTEWPLRRAMSFSLAHLSDLHLPPSQRVPWRRLNGKQFLAFLSWRRKRHRVHTFTPMGALLADLAAHAPDHIALTGDLVNFALPAEFGTARRWLEQRWAPAHVSIVPGNHDLTVQLPWRDGLGQWGAWMTGDSGSPPGGAGHFPFLRRRGELALIGLSTAVATPVFSAAGLLGPEQLDRLEGLLGQTGQEGLFRVVLLHHPPIMGPGGIRKALRDRAALCAVLKRQGAELVRAWAFRPRSPRWRGPKLPAGTFIALRGPNPAGTSRPSCAATTPHRTASGRPLNGRCGLPIA